MAREPKKVRKVVAEDEIQAPLAESAGHLLRDIHRMQSRLLQRRIAKFGVKFGSWYYLRVLWSGDGLSQHELSDRVQFNDATTRAAVDRMEDEGLVERRPHPEDRRKSCIYLTKRGKELKAKLLPIAVELNDVLLQNLSKTEQKVFLANLRRTRDNYNELYYTGTGKLRKPETPAT
jgi:MarR family transcriptional regulator, organic hydroperoxide resistance regulator